MTIECYDLIPYWFAKTHKYTEPTITQYYSVFSITTRINSAQRSLCRNLKCVSCLFLRDCFFEKLVN